MAGETECAETKNIINPRVEIDTSPPFESVKEAVDHFGGGGSWIPLHLLRLAAFDHHNNEPFDEMEKMEEQALQLESDLMIKEQQTHNVLKELEASKRLVEGLKVKLIMMPATDPNRNLDVPNESNVMISPASLMLNQAKLNLNRTSSDLAAIQTSLDSLNNKLRNDHKVLLERRRTKVQIQNSVHGEFSSDENHRRSRDSDKKAERVINSHDDIVNSLSNEFNKEVSFEAEQFKKMTEASRYEVMKAMTEIERTKNSIKMAEMRLNAAKKMEEAAKAVEAIALAGKGPFLIDGEDVFPRENDGRIMLSFEEYRSLAQKGKQAEELQVPILEKFEDDDGEGRPHEKNVVYEGSRNNLAKIFKFRNSHGGGGRRNADAPNGDESCFRSTTTTTIGDVLRRPKLMVQDDVTVGRRGAEDRDHDHSERGHVSLSQLLREQSRLIMHPPKTMTTGDGNHVEKQCFFQRRKFGFIQVPVYTNKQTKKRERERERSDF